MSRVSVTLGCMEFGRFTDETAALTMVKSFLGKHRELDTAIMYSGGKSEEIIGRFPADIKERSVVHTKVNPWFPAPERKGLTAPSINHQVEQSMRSLQLTPNKANPPIDILYLHAPDHVTPLEETLETMNELHQRGVYRRLGLSNYASFLVMKVHCLCSARGWVLPTVYQGMYNGITRAVETELFPCLQMLKMSFYVYNPLAGGILTGRYKFEEPPTENGRFAGNDWAEKYRERFWKKTNFDAIDAIKAAAKAAYGDSASLTDVSLRWLIHHSGLSGERGDSVIIGASKPEHVLANTAACEGGPLEQTVVDAIDNAWKMTSNDCPTYFR